MLKNDLINSGKKKLDNPFILWSHVRAASSQFVETYAQDVGLKVNLDEPIKKGTEKLEDLLDNQVSFKIMGYHSTEEIINQTINAKYDHIILFRKDIYRAYLSFSFSKLTNIWHKNQLERKEKGDLDIIKAMVKCKVYHNVPHTVKQIKRFYNDLNRVYLYLNKNNIKHKLIETTQAIDYLGDIGFQNTDKHYHRLENFEVKEELESFIKTLEMYKNHDMQSTI
jgi:hypothetical protein